ITVVFFHGWSNDMIKEINTNPNKFSKTFNKADKLIVLAQAFKRDLMKWEITRPIHLTTTKVNDELLNGFNYNDKPWDGTILFLTRIEIYKGIFTALEAYLEVKSKYPNATFTIAGNGAKLEEAKEFVRKNNLQDVRFLGNISEN